MPDLEVKWIVHDKAGRTWTFSASDRLGLVAFLWGKNAKAYRVYQLVSNIQQEITSVDNPSIASDLESIRAAVDAIETALVRFRGGKYDSVRSLNTIDTIEKIVTKLKE